jgi:hypothetical protein
MVVAHDCNPSYSRGRNQKDPISKTPITKKKKKKKKKGAVGVAQGIGPEFKP